MNLLAVELKVFLSAFSIKYSLFTFSVELFASASQFETIKIDIY